MEKINITELWKGNEQFDVDKIVLIAEKVNEIIDLLSTITQDNK